MTVAMEKCKYCADKDVCANKVRYEKMIEAIQSIPAIDSTSIYIRCWKYNFDCGKGIGM